jgi:DNA-binding beta-propeller fold protein YncE
MPRRRRQFQAVFMLFTAALLQSCSAPSGSTTGSTSVRGPIKAVIKVGTRPGIPAIANGALWVPNTGDGTVSKIDPGTDRVVATLKIGDQAAFYKRECEGKGSVHSFMVTSFHVRDCDLPSALAGGAGSLWVAKNDDRAVWRIQPSSGRVLARISVGLVPFDMAGNDKGIWVSGYWTDQLVRIDPSTNQVVARLTLPDGPSGIAITEEAVWVTSTIAGQVVRIDASSDQIVATIPLDCPATCYQGSLPLTVAGTAGAVWVRTTGDGLLVRVDPASNKVVNQVEVSYPLGRNGQDRIVAFEGGVWVCGVSLQRIDAQSGRLTGTIGVSATSVTAGFDSLWVTDILGRVERLAATVQPVS